jgi:hypothetical protein
MNHVFICHASEDKSKARRIASDLERHGVKVWLDERELHVGESLRERIEQALEKSHHVIVLLSRASAKKEWVKKELSAAFSIEIERKANVILPVLLDDARIPLLIRDKLYAKLIPSYRRGLEALLASIRGPATAPHERLENVSCIHRLKFVRLDGSLARYTRIQRLRCFDGEATQYQEEMTADGTLDGFQVTPGRIVKAWVRAGVTYVDTFLGRNLRKNQSLTREFTCSYRNSFCGKDEYFEAKQFSPTRKLVMEFYFPKGRLPSVTRAYERKGSDLTSLKKQPRLELAASHFGKISVRVSEPRLLSSYGLSWTW